MFFFKKALQFPKLIYEFFKINRNNIVWVVKPYSLCKKIRAAESGEQASEKRPERPLSLRFFIYRPVKMDFTS